MRKNIFYHPLTASPFKNNDYYREIFPAEKLRTWIRCFWGTKLPVMQEAGSNQADLIIPDTCADIIYHIDYTDHTVSGGFYGVNDQSFYAYKTARVGHLTAVFAIRFYAWSAYAFAEDSLKSTMNGSYEVEERFEWFDKLMRPKLLELKTLQEKVSYAEYLFMNRMQTVRENRIVNDAINHILMSKGALEISDLVKESFVGSRHLERLFHEYVGITPKKLSNLVRYQFLWRDILCQPDFHILDAVHKYGYTDQSHLSREFKRYHSMDIRNAKILAMENVENIQDIF